MGKLICPDCRTQRFFVKDPEDSFTLSAFTLENGSIEYTDTEDDGDRLAVADDTEIFCERCAWHDKFCNLKKIE